MRALMIAFLTGSALLLMSSPALAEVQNLTATPGQVQEFEGIHQVLGVLGKTNVYRLDKPTQQTFQEYTDIKNAVNNRPVEHVTTTSMRPQIKSGLQAPRRVNTRAF